MGADEQSDVVRFVGDWMPSEPVSGGGAQDVTLRVGNLEYVFADQAHESRKAWTSIGGMWRAVGGLDDMEMGADHWSALLAQEYCKLENSAEEEHSDDIAEVCGMAVTFENIALQARQICQLKIEEGE